MADPALVRRSVRDHAEILEALVKKRPKVASRLLERNWRAGMESVLTQLPESEPGISQ
jgi:DNA-binding GntR family transcriptional regulator